MYSIHIAKLNFVLAKSIFNIIFYSRDTPNNLSMLLFDFLLESKKSNLLRE